MTASSPSAPGPAKRRWFRIVAILFGGLLLLLVLGYFVGTSAWFLKSMVLPRVSKSVGADVTVADASISPFSRVWLKDLKVQAAGYEPVLLAPAVELRYSLMDIIGGNINVELVSVSSPVVQLVEDAEGRSNLDPILEAQEEAAAEPEKPEEPGKPVQLDLKKLAVAGGTVRTVKIYNATQRDVTELSNLNFTIENLRNDFTGSIAVAGDIVMKNDPPAPGTNGTLQGRLEGKFSLAMTKDLSPAAVQGSALASVTKAAGGLAMASGMVLELNSDVTPTAVKELALRFLQGNTRLGEVLVHGPFDMLKSEGRLLVEVREIDKRLLNLAGASSGLDFGPTRIGSTNEVVVANAGNVVTASGQFNVSQLQVTMTNQSTPPLDFRADYSLTTDLNAGKLVLGALNLNGVQEGKPFLQGSLSSPMTIAWGGDAGQAVGDSAFNAALTGFDLAHWRAFLGEMAPSGMVDARAQVVSKQAGNLLDFDVSSDIANLAIGTGSNQISQLAVKLHAKGQAKNLNVITLADAGFQAARQNQALVSAKASGTYDLTNSVADLQLAGQAQLANLLQALPRPDVKMTSGTAEFKGRVTQKGETSNIAGNFSVASLTGSFGENHFRNFASQMDLDIGVNTNEFQIRKISGKLSSDGKPGGGFDLTGNYNLNSEVARLNARIADLNQDGVRPFLESMFPGKALVSISINGSSTVQYDPNGASEFKADMAIKDLVVSDPKQPKAATNAALGADFKFDATLQKDVVDIRQAQFGLAPTTRAKNQVQLAGRVDMSKTNAMQGNVKITADSLDVTPYYDLFMGEETASAPTGSAPAQPAPSASAPAGSETEPEPVDLGMQDFSTDLTVGKFFLRELEITNLHTITRIYRTKADAPAKAPAEHSRVLIKPMQMALNGAPLEGAVDLNLGVPGYVYSVSFSAVQVPFAPLVNTFTPERRGQMGGTLTAKGAIEGLGTTGPNLQKHLKGNFDIGTTNLNLQVVNLKSGLLRTVVNVIAIVPEIRRNPAAGLGSLAGSLLGTRSGQGGGWADELSQSPVDVIEARGAMGGGKVNLERALIRSPAFQAETKGVVTLAPVLTNSAVEFPLAIAVKRSLAEKINFVPAGTPTNVAYVRLPDYVTIRGTVGEPKTDINKVALLGTALEQLGGSIPGVDQKTGNLIQGLGGILSGRKPQAGSTNQPAGTTEPTGTNQPPPPRSPLQGLSGLLGGATNSPAGTATNRPATTNQSPVGGLLDLLRKK